MPEFDGTCYIFVQGASTKSTKEGFWSKSYIRDAYETLSVPAFWNGFAKDSLLNQMASAVLCLPCSFGSYRKIIFEVSPCVLRMGCSIIKNISLSVFDGKAKILRKLHKDEVYIPLSSFTHDLICNVHD